MRRCRRVRCGLCDRTFATIWDQKAHLRCDHPSELEQEEATSDDHE